MNKLKRFYRQHGIRNDTDYVKPINIKLTTVKFPIDVVYHNVGMASILGPDNNSVPYHILKDDFYLRTVTEPLSFLGKPRLVTLSIKDVRKYNSTINNSLRVTTVIESLDKKLNAVVMNYMAINLRLRYKRHKLTPYHQVVNHLATVKETIINSGSLRHHIICIKMPERNVLEGIERSVLDLTVDKIVAKIKTPEDLMVVEFHKYMNNIPSILDDLREENLLFLFHNEENGVLVHNAAFSAGIKKVKERNLSNKLMSNLSDKSIAITSKFMSNLFNVIKLDEIVPEEVVEPVVLKQVPDDITQQIRDTTGSITQEAPTPSEALYTNIPPEKDKLVRKRIAKYKDLPMGITEGTMSTPIVVTKEELAYADTPLSTLPAGVIDDSMKYKGGSELDSAYIERGILEKDLGSAIQGLQAAGIVVTKIRIDDEENILGGQRTISVSMQPHDGSPSTIKLKIPSIKPDGTFKTRDVEYRMRTQKTELPIRKVSPVKVVLNSYYGVLFITRSTKVVNDPMKYIFKRLTLAANDTDQNVSMVPVPVFDHTINVPLDYQRYGQYMSVLHMEDLTLYFSYADRASIKGYSKSLEKKGSVVVGTLGNKVVVMNKKGELLVNNVIIPSVIERLNIDPKKLPKEITMIRIMGKEIPLGIYLASRIGISALIRDMTEFVVTDKVRHKTAIMSLRFADTHVHILKMSKEASLLINGLSTLLPTMRDFTFEEFKGDDPYILWLNDRGMSIKYFHEFATLEQMFIDRVSTFDLLKEMGEPTSFIPLLRRANELLTVEHHPRATGGKGLRLRGYERVAGFVYTELVKGVRGYKSEINPKKRKVDISPWDTWQAITGDSSVKPIEETNPIQYTKEQDTVTWTGAGGRSSTTITEEARSYDKDELGVIGEASTDSGDVGMVGFMSANPQLSSLRGINGSTLTDSKDAPASAYTTSYMLAPGIDKDHMPRQAFNSVQNTHIIQEAGAETGYVRTGFEYSLPFRLGKKFAWMAAEDGKVLGRTEKGMTVLYKSGKRDGVRLGITVGKTGNKRYPHTIITQLKKGDTFKKEHPLAWNEGFFQLDDFFPNTLIYKQAVLAKTGFMESLETYEDSCSIVNKLSPTMSTPILKEKSVYLRFDQNALDAVKVGDIVDEDTILLMITDQTSDSQYEEETTHALVQQTASVPRAKVSGEVISIEVRYNGVIADMSPSLAKLTRASDKHLKAVATDSNEPVLSGYVGNEYRVRGKPMLLNNLEVKILIKKSVGMHRGDKVVFGNQLKATAGIIRDTPWKTTGGVELDATFSYRAALARIVLSYQEVGSYSLFMYYLGEKFSDRILK